MVGGASHGNNALLAGLSGLPNALITGVAGGAINAAVDAGLNRLNLPAAVKDAVRDQLRDIVRDSLFENN